MKRVRAAAFMISPHGQSRGALRSCQSSGAAAELSAKIPRRLSKGGHRRWRRRDKRLQMKVLIGGPKKQMGRDERNQRMTLRRKMRPHAKKTRALLRQCEG